MSVCQPVCNTCKQIRSFVRGHVQLFESVKHQQQSDSRGEDCAPEAGLQSFPLPQSASQRFQKIFFYSHQQGETEMVLCDKDFGWSWDNAGFTSSILVWCWGVAEMSMAVIWSVQKHLSQNVQNQWRETLQRKCVRRPTAVKCSMKPNPNQVRLPLGITSLAPHMAGFLPEFSCWV